ncbi:MAG TPA: condensation domain-containing protein, partial [Candidatus Deferrimicrobium sp.]|nr:condensation domain-containing protein [Candidatus Deferrimicrobium sp.]
ESTAYNMPEIIPLAVGSDWEKMAGAFKKLIVRHESLRTSFHMMNEVLIQKIHDQVEFEIDKSFAELFQKRLIKSYIRPFDLSHAPLLRVGLIKNNAGSNLLLVDMHHIISDGVSHEILVKDFQALYNEEKIPSLRLQYKDFSEWQNSESEKENLKRQGEFWEKEFAGEIPVLELPVDYPRPLLQSFEGNSIDFEIAIEETRALNTVAQQQGATLFMMLTAVFNILLAKLSGQEEIVVGTPVAGRRHGDLEKIIGMFVNTLALRNYPSGSPTFKEFLRDVKERLLLVFENQEYPFEELVDKLSLPRDIGRNPLFDVMIVLQNMNIGSTEQAKATVQADSMKGYQNIAQAAQFDLSLTAMEGSRGLFLYFEYCTKLFKKETIDRFIYYFKKIAALVVQNPDLKIKDIEIISDEEKKQLVVEFNQTAAAYPQDKTIQQLFAEQVERTPDSIALVGADPRVCPDYLTYRQLNEQSAQLASVLIEKGVLADNIVAIMMERSIEMITGILGILKSGGAYLPIDPGYPQERIDYMLKDSAAKILLTVNDMIFNYHQPSVISYHSNQLAYIIYTSGTTGKPKGVAINHYSLVNRLTWMQKKYPLKANDVIL